MLASRDNYAQGISAPTLPAMAAVKLFGLLAFLSVLLLLSQTITSPLLSCLALAYYVLLSWYVVSYFPAAFVLLLWFIFIRLTMMISGVAIETGGFMPEFLMTGEPTGAFVHLAAVYTAGILLCTAIMTIAMRFLPASTHTQSPVFYSWFYLVFALVVFLCLWAIGLGLKHGFPALEGVDRILYWKQVSSRFLFFFLGNRPIFALLLGLIYSLSTGWNKRISLGIFLLVLVISLLFAEKFTSICMLIFSFVTPVFLRNHNHLQSLAKRLIPIGFVIAIITIPAILIAYGALDDLATAKNGLAQRATSQAQIWYVADRDQNDLLDLNKAALNQNLAAITAFNPEQYAQSPPYIGARYYMAAHMTRDRYAHYLDRGVTLTMATEGYLLHIFGWIGMLLPYAALLSVYAVYGLYLYFAIVTANPLRLILAGKLLVWANFGLNQGYAWFVIGLRPMALLAVIVMVEWIVFMIARNRRQQGSVFTRRAL